MNTQEGGPFYRGLKMLGKRQSPDEMLTQGSFVKYLLKLITSTPESDLLALKTGKVPKENGRPFNAFFNNGRDEYILQTMTNYFSAIRKVFPVDWNVRSYINEDGTPAPKPTPVFRRTVGYEALMRALSAIWPEVRAAGRTDEAFFVEKAHAFRRNSEGVVLTTDQFGSSSADAGKLADLLVRGP